MSDIRIPYKERKNGTEPQLGKAGPMWLLADKGRFSPLLVLNLGRVESEPYPAWGLTSPRYFFMPSKSSKAMNGLSPNSINSVRSPI